MSRKWFKGIVLVVATVMSISMISACTSSKNSDKTATTVSESGSTVPSEFVTLKVLYPGDESKRMSEFLKNEFAAKMKKELNVAVDVMFVPWDQYWNKKDTMIAAGEQIDWYWDGAPNLAKVVASKGNQPLDDLLNKYGQDIKKVIPKENLEANVIDGKLMAIPLQYGPTAEKFNTVLVRTDILKEVGMTEIKSIADIEKFAELALKKHPEMKLSADSPVSYLFRETFDYPYTTDGSDGALFVINEDSKKVESMVSSDGFMKAVKKARDWSEKGYIPEEVTLKWGEAGARFASGRYLLMTGAISRPLEAINDLRKNVPTAELEEFLLSPDKPKYRTFASTEAAFISSTSKHPERAMMMLNWMLKNQDNYLFSLYGVKDQDYSLDNNTIKVINQDSFWYEWMFRNVNYMAFPDTVSPQFIDKFKNWDSNAKLSSRFGFNFDQTTVKTEMTLLDKVMSEKVRPLLTGFLDYDKEIKGIQASLKSAGIEKVITEYQKQLDAFTKK